MWQITEVTLLYVLPVNMIPAAIARFPPTIFPTCSCEDHMQLCSTLHTTFTVTQEPLYSVLTIAAFWQHFIQISELGPGNNLLRIIIHCIVAQTLWQKFVVINFAFCCVTWFSVAFWSDSHFFFPGLVWCRNCRSSNVWPFVHNYCSFHGMDFFVWLNV